MDRKVIKIRADGGSQIGLGHWSRCSFLTDSAADFSKTLFTLRAREFQEAFPTSEMKVVAIEKEEDFINDISSNDIVVLDGYNFTADYINLLRKKESIIIYVDDIIYPGLAVDVIINHSEGVEPKDYREPAAYTSFFLGGHFSMVSSYFIPSVIKKEIRLKWLLISMGGADHLNYTYKVLSEYSSFIETFDGVDVIVGAHYPFPEKLKELRFLKTKVNIHQGVSKEKVAALMGKAGAAILPASTMALEYAHVRGLLVIIKTADNQEKSYQGLIQCGAALTIEDGLQTGHNKAHRFDELITRQSSIFDGLSEGRFKKLFNDLGLQNKIKLRRAAHVDRELTFKWATDTVLRSYSFSRREISWTEHATWFEKKINDTNCFYYIAEMDQVAIGFIRFDVANGDALISYLLDTSAQGSGLGRPLLVSGIKSLLQASHDISSLTGYVMPANASSIKIFDRMGFQREIVQVKSIDAIKFFRKIK